MQYRPYGGNGFEVSLLGLGCMRLPRLESGKVDKEKAIELIQYAAGHGINYFDTAYGYHSTTSESIVGEALEGIRKSIHIATKQPVMVMKEKADIRRNLENTLKKLRTDYLDVYLVHNIQKGTWGRFQELDVMEEYAKFKSEGLIKAVGFSYHGGRDTFLEVLGANDWDMCQIQQNLLDVEDEATEQAIYDVGKKGCALVIMEPLKGGGLANTPDSVKEIYEGCVPGRSAVEWAFRHLINYPQVSCILSGMTTMEQLKQNIEIFSLQDAVPNNLSPEEKRAIAQARDAYKAIVGVPCTACEYCMPCPSGVDIPGVFAKYNTANMFQQFDNPRRFYMYQIQNGQDASHCVECGACEQECPQHIKIIDQLKVAHEALKGWKE